jgi:CelD/BcsL family acetyltransferase involved in cellulose biosynthesis
MIVARCSRRRAAYRIGYVTFRSPTLRCLDIAYEGLLTDRQTGALSMTTEYLDGLLACGGVDLVSFNHLRTGQAEQMAAGAPRSILHSSDIHWRFQLVPGSYEQTIAGFSKKHRYNMRRADRLLVERFGGHVCLRIFAQKQELDEFIPQASRITAQSYHGGLGVGFVDNAVTRALVSAEARAGRLRCYWLEAEGKPIAHQVGCLYGDTYHLLATSFLPQYRELSPGHVLLVRVIEDLCGVGMRWIDYGFGDADYKRIYGTESWSEQTVRLYGRTARATLAWTLDVATTRGAAGGRAAAKRLGAIRRLKNTWRRRLTRDHTR